MVYVEYFLVGSGKGNGRYRSVLVRTGSKKEAEALVRNRFSGEGVKVLVMCSSMATVDQMAGDSIGLIS